jgi:hypothetical protein
VDVQTHPLQYSFPVHDQSKQCGHNLPQQAVRIELLERRQVEQEPGMCGSAEGQEAKCSPLFVQEDLTNSEKLDPELHTERRKI